MTEKYDAWNEWRSWTVSADLLPLFLKYVQGLGAGFSSGGPWAKIVDVKAVGDTFVVIARTCSYPYQENQVKAWLEHYA